MAGKIISGFSNIDISKQIAVLEQSDGYAVAAGISRANQTISVYHGETLIFDCTMPSTGIGDFPTVMAGQATLHDESFSGFVHGEAYTIVAGEEAPVTGFYVSSGILASFEADGLWAIFAFNGNVGANDPTNSHTKFSISQNVTTVKKRYDIKLLPEDLLPKTVAKKVDVQKAQKIADAAQNTADAAQNTAVAAQNTANVAMGSALWREEAYLPKLKTINIPRTNTVSSFSGYHLIPGETYTISATGLGQTAVWNGSKMALGAGTQTFTIRWDPKQEVYTTSSPDTRSIDLTGNFMPIIARPTNSQTLCNTLAPYVAFPRLNFVSQTSGSKSFIKMEAYDGSIRIVDANMKSHTLATQEYADGKALGMDITGASVGQIIKIKSVDANGKPTEWESVDIVNLLPIYDGGVS